VSLSFLPRLANDIPSLKNFSRYRNQMQAPAPAVNQINRSLKKVNKP